VRGKVIFIAILAMLVALVYLVGSRTRDAHVVPMPRPEGVADAGGPQEVGAEPEPGTVSASGSTPGTPGTPSSAPGHEVPDASALIERAVRVVAPAWELAAALYVANGGITTSDASAVHAARIKVEVTVSPDPRDVENRLARGGAEADGADVAVLALPAFVAAYERLRALEPQIVHVVGWSHGREALLGTKDGLLTKAPGAGDVTVAAEDPAATVLALFALDEAGMPPSRVRVAPDPKAPALAALVRPWPADRPADAPRKVLLTTADASRFVPFVAIAARGFMDGHPEATAALVRAWVDGASALRKDVPGAARRIAGEPGALEPAAMLERLAWVSDPGPGDEAFALGLTGSDAVTIPSLFARDWRLLRDVGALTSPAPSGSIIAAAPFSRAFAVTPPRPALPAAAADAGARVLLTRRVAKGDAEAVASEMALLAGIFESSAVRVTARPPSLAKDAADLASDRRGIRSDRLIVVASPLAEPGVAVLEVLAAP
jgi:ABC-type nitrate/sulfonate/bicarbonate transport system substrate-binding protein